MASSSPLGDTFGRRLSAYLTTPQDYRKYRERLSREVLRLRHELNIVTRDTKNYREKEQTSGIDAQKYSENEKFGSVLLLLAERSLVHALEIKSMLEIKGQQIPGYKKLMLGKLKLAVATSTQLAAAVAQEQDQLKKLEFLVFAALLHGQYAINKKRWTEARSTFLLARIGLEFLGSQLAEEGNLDLFGKTLLDEILDTLVDPSLALAHLQDSTSTKTAADLRTVSRKYSKENTLRLREIANIVSVLDPEFVEEIAEENVPRHVTWRSHEAQIYNDELAVKLNQISRVDWQSFKEANDYDALFSQWAALVEIHQGDVDKSADEDDMEKTQAHAVLLTYLKYNMLFVKVKRDLLLIDQLPLAANTAKLLMRNRDALRIYNSVVVTTEELKDLPGVYNDEDLYESLEELCKLFTVKRLAVIAASYAAANKLPEALRIYLHIDRTFTGSESYFKVDEFPYNVASNAQVQEFKKELTALMAKVHTLTQLQRESEGAFPTTVAENVHKFPTSIESLQNITNITEPGVFAPVLSKPVLFDVAFNYIGYNSQKERTMKKASTKEESDSGDKKKGGFFGIFGRG
ncbi:hypothetical protein HF325_002915 [Metschnikowia pulcherrima]|uniref:Signal recognition particle subunit SRP68 n=1 Tax=Metschnikowia pulcherrima TaxID=27326 RepID=A0A8H7LBX0_9ASCO|nr:hypothetical protein HF325_002915 [Metschnikowia pulcherrima]